MSTETSFNLDNLCAALEDLIEKWGVDNRISFTRFSQFLLDIDTMNITAKSSDNKNRGSRIVLTEYVLTEQGELKRVVKKTPVKTGERMINDDMYTNSYELEYKLAHHPVCTIKNLKKHIETREGADRVAHEIIDALQDILLKD